MKRHVDKFDETLFQFCYVDGMDYTQGMSVPFRLSAASPPSPDPRPMETSVSSVYVHNSPIVGDDTDDFVEIEDEDGEIVIIKSRSVFLEEELKKLESAAKVH